MNKFHLLQNAKEKSENFKFIRKTEMIQSIINGYDTTFLLLEKVGHSLEKNTVKLCKKCIQEILDQLVSNNNAELQEYNIYKDILFRKEYPEKNTCNIDPIALKNKIKNAREKCQEYNLLYNFLQNVQLLSKECVICYECNFPYNQYHCD